MPKKNKITESIRYKTSVVLSDSKFKSGVLVKWQIFKLPSIKNDAILNSSKFQPGAPGPTFKK